MGAGSDLSRRRLIHRSVKSIRVRGENTILLRVFSLSLLACESYSSASLERRMLMQLRHRMLLVIAGFRSPVGSWQSLAPRGQDRLIFSMDDPKGDDFGPGTYTPIHEAFSLTRRSSISPDSRSSILETLSTSISLLRESRTRGTRPRDSAIL